MLGKKTIKIINTLAYPITLQRSPSNYAKECLTNFVNDHPEISKQEIRSALDEAIQSSGWANELAVIGRHSEEDMKTFLVEVKKSLDTRL